MLFRIGAARPAARQQRQEQGRVCCQESAGAGSGELRRRHAEFRTGVRFGGTGRCNYCHVEDRASDEKMQKLIARDMIKMVREINGRFPDGKPHVSYYTCHRGRIVPAMAR
jgi:hypothetical protein